MATDADDALGMHVLRDTLEKLVDQATAAKVLFEAFDEPDGDEVPRDPDALVRFASGPLARALGRRKGEALAAELVRRVEQVARAAVGELEIPIVFDEDMQTSTVALADPGSGPVATLVISQNDRLVRRLGLALGPQRVAAMWANELAGVDGLVGPLAPQVVVVDGQSPVAIDADVLAERMRARGGSVLVLVWASDEAYGRALVAALDQRGVAHAAIPRDAGVDPLVDYLRARTADV